MAKFIEVSTRAGERYINVEQIIYVRENPNTDKDEYPGYILPSRSMMDGIRTRETYEQLVQLIITTNEN